MTSLDRHCPCCGSENYTLNDHEPAYGCQDCGALWQERMETDDAGNITGIGERLIIREGNDD